MDPLSYRTSSLFHFTKNDDVIRSILETGIIPNYCKENLCYEDRDVVIGIPMVSFCDIPLTRTSEFTKRYGDFAIGLSKEWAIMNHINPILYVNDARVLMSLGFMRAYLHSQEQEVRDRGGNEKKITINILSPESLKGLTHFINMNNAKDAVYSLYGYVKKYSSPGPDGHDEENYIENEWRYVVTGDSIDWKWSEKDYKAWRGKGRKPEPIDALKAQRLRFSVDDVTHIILEKEKQIGDMVDFILNMDHIGGNEVDFPYNEKKILLTKIISLEKIGKDF